MTSTSPDPLVTVCIPSYNHERFVGETIQSIIEQTYKNVELIIIDDGSSDDSLEVIESFRPACEQRFARFEIRSRPNKGLSRTLNEGLEWARGEYFSLIASDDVLLPHKLALLAKTLNGRADLAGAFGGVVRIDDAGEPRGSVSAPGLWEFSDIFLGKARLSAPAALLKTDKLRAVQGFDEDLLIEDWSMWLKLTEDGKSRLLSVPEAVAKYRIHGSNTHKRVDEMHQARMRIIDRYSEHAAHLQARSRASATSAIAATSVSKWSSLRYLRLAKNAPLTMKIWVLIKLLLPQQAYDAVVQLRNSSKRWHLK